MRILCSSALAVAALTLGSGPCLAQQQDGAATAVNAIGEAVQQGHNPYHPQQAKAAVPVGSELMSEECQQLLREYNATPAREYQRGGRPITTSQGRVVQGLERTRSRDDVLDTFRARCMH